MTGEVHTKTEGPPNDTIDTCNPLTDDIHHHGQDELPPGAEKDTHHHHLHHSGYDDTDAATSALIAEAAAAAVHAAAVDVDITAAALAAQDAAQDMDDAAAAAAEKKKENRRKRYREKTVEAAETLKKRLRDDPSVSTHVSLGSDGMEGILGSGMHPNRSTSSSPSHAEQLAARRLKDRQRYASMTPAQREVYNSKRREQYHKQNEISRQKRRERERNRYHSLDSESAKDRNARRAKLERERYQKMKPEDLEAKNRRRRERAAALRAKKEAVKATDFAGINPAQIAALAVEAPAPVTQPEEFESKTVVLVGLESKEPDDRDVVQEIQV